MHGCKSSIKTGASELMRAIKGSPYLWIFNSNDFLSNIADQATEKFALTLESARG
jgi:hypothetical protein